MVQYVVEWLRQVKHSTALDCLSWFLPFAELPLPFRSGQSSLPLFASLPIRQWSFLKSAGGQWWAGVQARREEANGGTREQAHAFRGKAMDFLSHLRSWMEVAMTGKTHLVRQSHGGRRISCRCLPGGSLDCLQVPIFS